MKICTSCIPQFPSLFSSGFSQASHSCRPQAVQGYFLESTTCTCSLISDGHPRGTAQWYKRGQLVGSSGSLVVSRDKSSESCDDVWNQLLDDDNKTLVLVNSLHNNVSSEAPLLVLSTHISIQTADENGSF